MTDVATAESTRERVTEPVLRVTVGDRVPKLRQIVLIALVTAAFVLVWFTVLAFLPKSTLTYEGNVLA